MGIPKHGKNSAKAKSNERYKSEGRYQKNKARKALKNQKRLDKISVRKAEREANRNV